jgi:parvulin-like peptidyl-prolyl isomerase
MNKAKENKKLSPYAYVSLACAIVIALAMVFGAAVSFSRQNDVMRYEGVSIDEEMYCYWFSYYKMEAMAAYGISGKNDTQLFWKGEMSDGVTYGEKLTKIIDERIKTRLVCAYLFDSLGASLPDYAKEEINEYLSQTLDFVADNDKKAFSEIAEKYGTSYDAIKKVAAFDYKSELLFTMTYGNGEYLSDEEKDEYYRDKYSRVKVIFINTNTKSTTKGDDSSKVSVVELTEEEKKQKAELADKVQEKLSPADYEKFDELVALYSEDSASSHYKNGFYLCEGSDYPVTEVTQAALSLEVGACVRVESDYGIHFVMRYPLDDAAYDDKENSDWFDSFALDASVYFFDSYIKNELDKVKVNEDVKSRHTIENIKYNYEIKPIITD